MVHSRRKLFELAELSRAPLAIEAVRRIDAIFDAERAINGLPAEARLAVRQQHIAPLVTELETWMRESRGQLSRHSPVAKAMDYMLTRWETFARFLSDGRICLTNNAAERALRGIAMTRSLCPSFSSAGKDWKFVLPIGTTRTTSRRQGLDHLRALQIGSPDLPRCVRDNLLCKQNAVFDELADAMAGGSERRRSLRHGEPLPVLLG